MRLRKDFRPGSPVRLPPARTLCVADGQSPRIVPTGLLVSISAVMRGLCHRARRQVKHKKNENKKRPLGSLPPPLCGGGAPQDPEGLPHLRSAIITIHDEWQVQRLRDHHGHVVRREDDEAGSRHRRCGGRRRAAHRHRPAHVFEHAQWDGAGVVDGFTGANRVRHQRVRRAVEDFVEVGVA